MYCLYIYAGLPVLLLLCRRGDEVVHVKIKHEEEGFAVKGGETFATLSELIHSYVNRHEDLTEKNGHQILLKQPLNCSDPTSERYSYIFGHVRYDVRHDT